MDKKLIKFSIRKKFERGNRSVDIRCRNKVYSLSNRDRFCYLPIGILIKDRNDNIQLIKYKSIKYIISEN